MRTSGLQPGLWLRRWPCGLAEPLLAPGGTQGRCEPKCVVGLASFRTAAPVLVQVHCFPTSRRSRARTERVQVPYSRLSGQ